MNLPKFLTQKYAGLIRSSILFILSVVLMFVVSSFKVKNKEIANFKPNAPTCYISSIRLAGTDIDYVVYDALSNVIGSGTLCGNSSTVILSSTGASISFGPTGSMLYSMSMPSAWNTYCINCAAFSGGCTTPGSPWPDLEAHCYTVGIDTHFEFR